MAASAVKVASRASRTLARPVVHRSAATAFKPLLGQLSSRSVDRWGQQRQVSVRWLWGWGRGKHEDASAALADSPTPGVAEESDASVGGGDAAATGLSNAARRSSTSDGNSGAIVPVSNSQGNTMVRDTGPPFEPLMIGLPLPKRPLFPGQQQFVHVTHVDVIKGLAALLEKGTPPFVGAFLRRADHGKGMPGQLPELLESDEDFYTLDPLDSLHHVGTRARIIQASPFVHQGKDGMVEGLQMLLHGHDLVKLEKVLEVGPPLRLQVSKMKFQPDDDPITVKAYINETMHTIREIMKINPQFREHAAMMHQAMQRLERGDPHATAHFAAALTTASGAELADVLEAENPSQKLRLALMLLKKELELSQLQLKISTQIDEKVSSHQREFMLREQLKMIKKELGEDKNDGAEALLRKFQARLEGKNVPKEVKEVLDSELDKFSGLAKESQEFQTTRNYLDWLTQLPWGVLSPETLNLAKARSILDRDHYGLNDVKERIQELIAVGSLRGEMQGKILLLVGPPGVGKTSIGRSIAEALGRSFYRFSVGGLYDVAEIKGHRRTYVGAMPGKMIQCLKKTQTINPLVLIDEVDKIGRGHQGDPASALLELLDPSQNQSFLDHYLDVPVDCSKVLFVCTANVTDTIPGPLLDRMEVIRLSGYDLQEKLRIAEDYLVPTAMREVGLWPPQSSTPVSGEDARVGERSEVTEVPLHHDADLAAGVGAGECVTPSIPTSSAKIEGGAVEALIRWYCREAGVRNLQKHIEKICRKLATRAVEHRERALQKFAEKEKEALADQLKAKTDEKLRAPPEKASAAASTKTPTIPLPSMEELDLTVTEDRLHDLVGKPPFTSDRLYEGQTPPGTVTGLAWTAMGGSVLYIEATAIPRLTGVDASQDSGSSGVFLGSTPTLSVTGQLGSVMKESSQIALLVARQQLTALAPTADPRFFHKHELYLHCPEGATPKDGPSAGITMVTALLSLAMNRPVRAELAMTGEVSLNGKVLAVGGLKEKTIAARRAGCHALVFPEACRRDFDELPAYLREGLEVHFASEYKDVFAFAFRDAEAMRSEASETCESPR